MNPVLRRVLIALGALSLAAVVGIAGSSKLEENNGFCNACHVHTGIYERFTASGGSDLAKEHAHATKGEFKCIFCHREPGIDGHAVSLYRAGRALTAYVTGRYERPIVAAEPPTQAVCRRCHHTPAEPAATKVGGKRPKVIKDHYHRADVLAKGGAKTGVEFKCTKCHSAHDKRGQKMRWLARESFKQECVRCHKALGGLGEESENEEFRKVWTGGRLLTEGASAVLEAGATK